ncbi:MAG: TetR/AcrR family transcriptional regulator [Desulfobacteraceae bacterium]|jgi:AcrR family transcriptional regulator
MENIHQKDVISFNKRRSIQKEETRNIILESARILFNESGFDKTSTRTIAKKAGVGTGTVFSHFPDKLSLLIAALLDDLTSTHEEALKTLPEGAHVCDKFLHFAHYFYSYYSKRPELSRTLLKEMMFAKGEWGNRLLSHADQFVLFVTSLLEEAKQKGDINPEMDTKLCATAFFSYYLNVLFMGLSEDEIDLKKMIDLLRRLIMQLIDGETPGKRE